MGLTLSRHPLLRRTEAAAEGRVWRGSLLHSGTVGVRISSIFPIREGRRNGTEAVIPADRLCRSRAASVLPAVQSEDDDIP